MHSLYHGGGGIITIGGGSGLVFLNEKAPK